MPLCNDTCAVIRFMALIRERKENILKENVLHQKMWLITFYPPPCMGPHLVFESRFTKSSYLKVNVYNINVIPRVRKQFYGCFITQ